MVETPSPPAGLDANPSAFASAMGVTVRTWDEGHVLLDAPICPWHLNRSGIVHGGIASAMIDMACGFAGLWVPPGAPPKHALTLSLTVQFTGQARAGLMRCEGRVKTRGKRVYFTEATLWVDGGDMLAFGSGTFRLRSGR